MIDITLRDDIPADALLAAVADVLGVGRADLTLLDDDRDAPLCVVINRRREGFRTTVSVFGHESLRAWDAATSFDIARRMAAALDTDAVVDIPGARPPYDWLVIRPNGDLLATTELAGNDDDRFALDEGPEWWRGR